VAGDDDLVFRRGAMMLPPEKPATWADETSSARSTPAASSAIASTEIRSSGIAVRPAPRLSKAVKRFCRPSPREGVSGTHARLPSRDAGKAVSQIRYKLAQLDQRLMHLRQVATA
jgi:hypothetical protein